MKIKLITKLVLVAGIVGMTFTGCGFKIDISRDNDNQEQQKKEESVDFNNSDEEETIKTAEDVREILTFIRNSNYEDDLEKLVKKVEKVEGISRERALNLIYDIKCMTHVEFDMLVRQQIAIVEGDDETYTDLLIEEDSQEYIELVKDMRIEPFDAPIITGKDKDPDLSQEDKRRIQTITFDSGIFNITSYRQLKNALKIMPLVNERTKEPNFIVIHGLDEFFKSTADDVVDLDKIELYGYPVKINKDYIYINQIIDIMRSWNLENREERKPLALIGKFKEKKDGFITLELSDCINFENNVLGTVKIPLN